MTEPLQKTKQLDVTEIDDFKLSIHKALMDLAKYKDEYIRAWLAETGLLPHECVMVEKQEGLSTRMWLEKRRPEDSYEMLTKIERGEV